MTYQRTWLDFVSSNRIAFRIISCVELGVLLAVVFVSPYAKTSHKNFHQLLLQGRFGGDAQGSYASLSALPITYSWPASSASFSFESTAINITISSLPATYSFSGYNRFSIQLDQVASIVQTQDPNNTKIQWAARGLNSSVHTLTVTKLSEALYGHASLEAITLAATGRQAASANISLSYRNPYHAAAAHVLILLCHKHSNMSSSLAYVSAYVVQICKTCHDCGYAHWTTHSIHW